MKLIKFLSGLCTPCTDLPPRIAHHAFTLAEVLITLGIIGVVAALTIPNIAKNIRNYTLETQFKNVYAKTTQAIKMAKLELDIDTFKQYCIVYNAGAGGYNNLQTCRNAVYNSYNTSKGKLFKSNASGYYSVERLNQIKNFTGDTITSLNSYAYFYPMLYTNVMLDGSYFGMGANNYALIIAIDTNGESGPNRLGYDVFFLTMDNKDNITGFQPDGNVYTQEDLDNMSFSSNEDLNRARAGNPCNSESPQVYNGIGCGWYAIKDICPTTGEKGYFKCLK